MLNLLLQFNISELPCVFMRYAAVFCVLLILLLDGCHPAAAPVAVSNRSASKKGAPIEKPLKDMKWIGSNGRAADLNDLAGKVVILDFWATYCPPCREEIPHLNALQS